MPFTFLMVYPMMVTLNIKHLRDGIKNVRLQLLGIVFVAIALKAKQLYTDPAVLLTIFVPLLIIYSVNFLLSTLAGKMFFDRGDAVALVYGTVMRNLSIALAIAINAFGAAGADAALVICVSYIVRVQSAAWYVRLTDTIFGPPRQEAAV